MENNPAVTEDALTELSILRKRFRSTVDLRLIRPAHQIVNRHVEEICKGNERIESWFLFPGFIILVDSYLCMDANSNVHLGDALFFAQFF